MAEKKTACECCGQFVWSNKLTILDLAGWDMETGDPTKIHNDRARLSMAICKECLQKKVSDFLKTRPRSSNTTPQLKQQKDKASYNKISPKN